MKKIIAGLASLGATTLATGIGVMVYLGIVSYHSGDEDDFVDDDSYN